jgi:hypothetical protein
MTFARALALGAIMLLVAIAIAGSPVRAADTEVKIDNFTFNPKQVTMKASDTITWSSMTLFRIRGSPMSYASPKALDTTTSSRSHSRHRAPSVFLCSSAHLTGMVVVEARAGK